MTFPIFVVNRRSAVRSLAGVSVIAALLPAAGCGGGDVDGAPPGTQLLRQAADTVRGLTSVNLLLKTQGAPEVKVQSVDAWLQRSGDAWGSVRASPIGTPVELNFVFIGQTVYLKGPTGGWQRRQRSEAATIYDPSTVLDPNRGLPELLRTATGAKTTGHEWIEGQETYRVHASLAKEAVARLVPGVSATGPADIWITTREHQPLRIRMPLPRHGGDPGTATATFADWDQPVTVKAPV